MADHPRLRLRGGAPRLETRGGTPIATNGPHALAVCSWGAGDAQIDAEAIFGRFEAREGSSALIALCAAHQEPLVFPRREHVEARLEATSTYWRDWAASARIPVRGARR